MFDFVPRTLRQLRNLGGAHAEFTYLYVGDRPPVSRPHEGRWPPADDHWELVTESFGDAGDILKGLSGRKARDEVENVSIGFLKSLALMGNCPMCGPTATAPPGGNEPTREAEDER